MYINLFLQKEKMKYFFFLAKYFNYSLIFRYTCGAVEFYDKSYDRVTCKLEKQLQRINRIFHKVTTTDDPIIRHVSPLTYG